MKSPLHSALKSIKAKSGFKLPEQAHGTLAAKQTSSTSGKGGLWVAALEDIPEELRTHLERVR